MIPLLSLVWVILFVLVLIGHCILLIWYSWPAWHRVLYCPWCWQDCHVMRYYPARWSSTICAHHEQRIRQQSAARRAQRCAHLQLVEN